MGLSQFLIVLFNLTLHPMKSKAVTTQCETAGLIGE